MNILNLKKKLYESEFWELDCDFEYRENGTLYSKRTVKIDSVIRDFIREECKDRIYLVSTILENPSKNKMNIDGFGGVACCDFVGLVYTNPADYFDYSIDESVRSICQILFHEYRHTVQHSKVYWQYYGKYYYHESVKNDIITSILRYQKRDISGVRNENCSKDESRLKSIFEKREIDAYAFELYQTMLLDGFDSIEKFIEYFRTKKLSPHENFFKEVVDKSSPAKNLIMKKMYKFLEERKNEIV